MIKKEGSGYFILQEAHVLCQEGTDLGRKKNYKNLILLICHFRTILKEAREDFNKSNTSFLSSKYEIYWLKPS